MKRREDIERIKALWNGLIYAVIGAGGIIAISASGTIDHQEPRYEFGPAMARQIGGR